MAYTKSPTLDTYSSERVQLYREMSTRDGGLSGKDEDYVNIFIETIKQQAAGDSRKFITKRSGTYAKVASVASLPVRGIIYWADQYKIFYCVGTNVYVHNVNTNTTTTISSVFTSTSGEVGFCEYLYDTGTVVIVATDGTTLVTIDNSNTVTPCTDPDLPTPHQPFPIFLDGYLFLAKSGTADIYNSINNDPLDWTAGTFISAEMEADLVIRIAKLNNYLVVFGKETIEYFWDAAGVAPDSPLQRNDSPVKINTYLAGFAIYGNSIYYIGTDAGGQPDVFTLKDFKIDSIGSPAISRYLNDTTGGIDNWTGNIIAIQGHTFYLITAGTLKTYVCDLDTKLWTRWTWKNTNTFDILHSINLTDTYNTKSCFALAGNDSTLYSFNSSLNKDDGVLFPSVIVTENNDFGTVNRKTMKRLSIIGDRPADSSPILVQWSDNDYQTFNTGVYTDLNQDNPCIYRLGSFRQRVFKLTHLADTPLRIQEIEVDINKGNS
jgi:hypothetical protein